MSGFVDPWPEHRCHAELARVVSDQFTQVINDALDERPAQQFLAQHPELLGCMLRPGNGVWAFDRPALGSEYIPDFLLSTYTSAGYRWAMVELESPVARVLTAAKLPARKLNEALGQIRDWRAWIRKNIAYAQSELGFVNLDAECPAFVVIGRRSQITKGCVSQYRELSTAQTTVLTYDRLIDAIGNGRSHGELSNG